MTAPTLYIFTISHYCEKARWALEHLGIAHKVKPIAPGLHMKKAKKLGLKRGSVPILVSGDMVIQGSSAIIDWAGKHSTTNAFSEVNETDADAIEKRLDDILGVHLRRMFYSEAIVHHPETIRPIFEKDMGFFSKTFIKTQWNTVCKLMIKGMDLGDRQGLESQQIVEGELNWIDELLSDGRRYLMGDEFSRVDITAASLLGPLVNPPEHPAYGLVALPPKVAETVSEWADRPSLKYVTRMYQAHR